MAARYPLVLNGSQIQELQTGDTINLTSPLSPAQGGTGLTTLATGSLSYGAGTSAFSTLAIGTAGQILTVNSGATAPQWSTLSGVAVTTFSAGTTGLTPSTATSGAVTLAGTLATTNGGTGLTSFTANGVVYASSTSALATGSALTFDGTNLGLSGTGARFINIGTTSTNGQSVALQISAPNSDASANVYRIGSGLTANNELVSYDVTNGQLVDKYIRGSSGFRAFWTNGAECARITSGGNVGIGTSSPSYLLEVKGSSAQMGVTGTGTASNYLAVGNTNASNTFYFGQDNSAGNNFNTGVAYGPVIWTNASSQTFVTNGGTNAMTYSGGNFLVGTTSTSGSVNNTSIVLGGIFRTISGNTGSVATNTYATLFTVPAGYSSYIVTVYLYANDVNDYQSVVVVSTQAGPSTKVNVLVSSGLLSFQMSGYSLQAAQQSGATQTIYWQAVRIF